MRQRTTLPMVLDECIRDVHSLLRAYEANAMEAFNLKISKVGGLTQAKLMRDLAVALGLRVTIEDAWGGDLVTAAVSHLAASTPPETLFTVSFMNDWTNEHVAGYEPRSQAGFGSAPQAPGLGIEVDVAALGAPLPAAGALNGVAAGAVGFSVGSGPGPRERGTPSPRQQRRRNSRFEDGIQATRLARTLGPSCDETHRDRAGNVTASSGAARIRGWRTGRRAWRSPQTRRDR